MAFATRADLLARSNARRLAQLAVPTDQDMVPDEALRAAIAGGDLSLFSVAEQASLVLALEAIDKALADADALLLSYGLAATVQGTLLARLASTVALYYLQGAERLDKQDAIAYEGAIATLKAHARGELNLAPPVASDPVIVTDSIFIESQPSRYSRSACPRDDWS
jgi:phage gp36-like protein